MARYFAVLALLGAVLGAPDGGSHHAASAPAASYGAPTGGYEQPSYEAPAASYAPASYEQPSYDAPATGYAEPTATGYDASYSDQTYAVQDTVDGFDLSKLLELLPLFIAVFAAIILAQLLAPLFMVLFDAKVGLLGGIINPFGQAKLDIVNAILVPLGYRLSNAALNAAPATWPPVKGRSISEMGVLDMISMAEDMFNGIKYTALHCRRFKLFFFSYPATIDIYRQDNGQNRSYYELLHKTNGHFDAQVRRTFINSSPSPTTNNQKERGS